MSALIIGLTGGIASGKSAATAAFERRGIRVADADIAARDAVRPGSAGLDAVVAQFGPDALLPDGTLDRAAMRQRIFADPGARERLEAIIHPQVRLALQMACEGAPGPYAIAAIPLLAEGGRHQYPWLQRVLVIDVPVAVQLSRLLARDGIDHTLATQMIDAQASREARLSIADDVIANDDSLTMLDRRIGELDARYRALAATQSRG